MKHRHFLGLVLITWAAAAGVVRGQVTAIKAEEFAEPPLELKSRPLWFWNQVGTTPEQVRQIMTECRDRSGYYGFGILPAVEREKYLGQEYFALYGAALDTAGKLGLKMCLYDEYWFPSGSAGGQFARRFPHLVLKRLDMQAVDVEGPARHGAALPAGTLMAAVAMNLKTLERIDLHGAVSEGKLAWDVPRGRWKIMVFTCVPEGPIMDYLNREATEKFLQITHEQYFKRFPDHFGTTIDSVFYDEPTLYRNQGRAWTETFNAQFQKRCGRSPATLYPALWMDIGPQTAAARVALFGLRAELFSTEYIGVMDRWCREHKVRLTGHMDQEQVENVTLISGDLLKVFQHQAIPGLDEVFAYRRTQRAYKLISSAAYNWDKESVMSETYGAIKDMPVEMLTRMGMDLYAKGINFMVPHAVWTDPKHIIFPPELSWRDPKYGPALAPYNRWIGRLNLMLRGGRHVADVAVLYPVAALQAGTRFDAGNPYTGGPTVPEADYMDVGEILSLEARRDFTYLHPEVLQQRGAVEGNVLHLRNEVRPERYRVLVLPGAAVAPAGCIAQARRFFDSGGIVIATTQLPLGAAEFTGDESVRRDVRHVFGVAKVQRPKKEARASSVFGPGYEPQRALDGLLSTRWNSSDHSAGPQWLELVLPEKQRITRVTIREAFDRVRRHSVQYWDAEKSAWVTCARGERIGPLRVHRFEPVETSRLRLQVDDYETNCLSIREFGVGDALAHVVVHGNDAGGKAFFLPAPDAATLRGVLDKALPVPDVSFDPPPEVTGGNFSYIHVARADREVYFLANSSDTPVATTVALRGRMDLELWDPHSGVQAKIASSHAEKDGQPVTMVPLKLAPCHAVFLVGRRR